MPLILPKAIEFRNVSKAYHRGSGSMPAFDRVLAQVTGKEKEVTQSKDNLELAKTRLQQMEQEKADLERALAVVSRQRRRLAPVLRELDLVRVVGRAQCVRVYELVAASAAELPAEKQRALSAYAAGLDA